MPPPALAMRGCIPLGFAGDALDPRSALFQAPHGGASAARQLPPTGVEPRHAARTPLVMDFSPCGGYCAVGCDDGVIFVFDVLRWELHLVLAAAPGAVTCLRWAAQGRKLFTAGTDMVLRVWDVASGDLDAEQGLPSLPLALATCPCTSAARGFLLCAGSHHPMAVALMTSSIRDRSPRLFVYQVPFKGNGGVSVFSPLERATSVAWGKVSLQAPSNPAASPRGADGDALASSGPESPSFGIAPAARACYVYFGTSSGRLVVVQACWMEGSTTETRFAFVRVSPTPSGDGRVGGTGSSSGSSGGPSSSTPLAYAKGALVSLSTLIEPPGQARLPVPADYMLAGFQDQSLVLWAEPLGVSDASAAPARERGGLDVRRGYPLVLISRGRHTYNLPLAGFGGSGGNVVGGMQAVDVAVGQGGASIPAAAAEPLPPRVAARAGDEGGGSGEGQLPDPVPDSDGEEREEDERGDAAESDDADDVGDDEDHEEGGGAGSSSSSGSGSSDSSSAEEDNDGAVPGDALAASAAATAVSGPPRKRSKKMVQTEKKPRPQSRLERQMQGGLAALARAEKDKARWAGKKLKDAESADGKGRRVAPVLPPGCAFSFAASERGESFVVVRQVTRGPLQACFATLRPPLPPPLPRLQPLATQLGPRSAAGSASADAAAASASDSASASLPLDMSRLPRYMSTQLASLSVLVPPELMRQSMGAGWPLPSDLPVPLRRAIAARGTELLARQRVLHIGVRAVREWFNMSLAEAVAVAGPSAFGNTTAPLRRRASDKRLMRASQGAVAAADPDAEEDDEAAGTVRDTALGRLTRCRPTIVSMHARLPLVVIGSETGHLVVLGEPPSVPGSWAAHMPSSSTVAALDELTSNAVSVGPPGSVPPLLVPPSMVGRPRNPAPGGGSGSESGASSSSSSTTIATATAASAAAVLNALPAVDIRRPGTVYTGETALAPFFNPPPPSGLPLARWQVVRSSHPCPPAPLASVLAAITGADASATPGSPPFRPVPIGAFQPFAFRAVSAVRPPPGTEEQVLIGHCAILQVPRVHDERLPLTFDDPPQRPLQLVRGTTSYSASAIAGAAARLGLPSSDGEAFTALLAEGLSGIVAATHRDVPSNWLAAGTLRATAPPPPQ